MSQHFTPDKGTHFYVSRVPYERVIGDSLFGGIDTKPRVIQQQDNSYRDEVMLCVGRDSHAVLAERVHPGYGNGKPLVLPVAMWNFYPVGPEVLSALGLSAPESA
jgi:hypothetical protein